MHLQHKQNRVTWDGTVQICDGNGINNETFISQAWTGSCSEQTQTKLWELLRWAHFKGCPAPCQIALVECKLTVYCALQELFWLLSYVSMQMMPNYVQECTLASMILALPLRKYVFVY